MYQNNTEITRLGREWLIRTSSRMFPLEFVNLGFSGNAQGEPELAQIISEIPDPALLVLDYEGNMPSTGEELLRFEYAECTVDGIHPSDLGYKRISEALKPLLEKLLRPYLK